MRRVDAIDYPDRMIFDLDPAPDVPFEAVKLAAQDLRQRLQQKGLESVLKCTGGKGLHVTVPLAGKDKWPVVKSFAASLAEEMVAAAPEAYVATMSKAKRTGKIFIDYFRNDYTATAIADYAVRARPGAPVALPLEWKELEGPEIRQPVHDEGCAEAPEEQERGCRLRRPRRPDLPSRVENRIRQEKAWKYSSPSDRRLPALSNAEIADRLASLAQLLSTQKENPYKVKAYRRAAASIRTLSESIDELVREEADLTRFDGIGEAISSAIREIVLTGTLGKLEKLRSEASPALASISAYPRLDPKRVLRIYKKLNISSVEELREQLESGAIEKALGQRMAQHVRQGLTETHGMLLYRADDLRDAVEEFLVAKCGVRRAEVVGDYRRRAEIIEEMDFIIETDDFPSVVAKLQRYGGRTPLVSSSKDTALFALSSGIQLRIQAGLTERLGLVTDRVHGLEGAPAQARPPSRAA